MSEVKKLTKEEMAALSAPFNPSEIVFRPGSFNREGTATTALPHITARHVQERLDEVFPGEWNVKFEVLNVNQIFPELLTNIIAYAVGNDEAKCKDFLLNEYNRITSPVVKCTISIPSRGIEVQDIGEANRWDNGFKAAASDAFKRAAVHLGIGRYLYSLPVIWIDWEGDRYYGHFKVDPATILFDENGNVLDTAFVHDTKNRKPKSKRVVKDNQGTVQTFGGDEVAEMPNAATNTPTPQAIKATSAQSKVGSTLNLPSNPTLRQARTTTTPTTPKSPTVPSPPNTNTAANNDSNGTPNEPKALASQIMYLADVGSYTETTLDYSNLTLQQASDYIRQYIASTGNENPPTIPQISLLFKLCEERGLTVPENLPEYTVGTMSELIKNVMTKQ